MPEALELIADGVRAQRAGASDRALESFQGAADRAPDASTKAEALTHLASVLRNRCEWELALETAREARRIAAAAGLDNREAEAAIAEANIHLSQGNFQHAVPNFTAIAADATDPRIRGIALQNLGSIYAQTGDRELAQRAFTQSLGNFQAAGYKRGEGMALNNLGRFELDNGDCKNARLILERALVLAREVEDLDLAALASVNLSWALCEDGDLDHSQDLAMAALGYYSDCANRWREIECFRLIGTINEKAEDFSNARRCFELALNLAQEIGSEHEIAETTARLSALPATELNEQPAAS
jgi:tetratricopeptide (TPR) repeat protein